MKLHSHYPLTICLNQTRLGLVKIINIQAAKTHLSRLVEEVVAGEEVILAKAGKPLVRLVPFTPPAKERVFGTLKGKIWEAPDCWDHDENLEQVFYGEAEWEMPAPQIAEKPE